MKAYFFLFSCFILQLGAFAQEGNVKVYSEKVNGKMLIYADNTFPCPVTVNLNFTAKTQNACPADDAAFVVQANTQKSLLTSVSACDKNKVWYVYYKFNYWFGDTNLQTYNANFAYALPFEKGKSYKLSQGYFGKFSHQKVHALDFLMPEGTPVCAMRSGVVIKVKYDSNIGGADLKFANDANYITIYHNDGTLGMYLHFQQNGVAVAPGDQVKKGQIIGYSGNTGFSSTPHLHVEVKLPSPSGPKSISCKYVSGGITLDLQQGNFYKNE